MAVLSITATLMGAFVLVRTYGYPPRKPAPLEVHLAEGHRGALGVFILDPNTAPVDSLELLPGIGPVLAARIAEYRQHTRFEQASDVTAVKGIGPKLYERLKPFLRVPRQ